jgi:uncharacterized protein YcnI
MRTIAIALGLSAAATAAQAHIVLQETEAKAGAYYVAAFRVGHGCEGQATTALSIELPEGVEEAKPQPKPGFAFERSGRTVTWRGRVADSEFELFPLLVKLPAKAGPLYFPAVQTCGAVQQRWIEIPAPGAAWTSVPHPAPVVTLTGGGAPAAAADPMAGHVH